MSQETVEVVSIEDNSASTSIDALPEIVTGKDLEQCAESIHEPITSQQQFLLIGIIAILGLLTWPVWRWLWSEWMANDYYSHGLLILPVSLFLAWRRLTVDPMLRLQWFQQDIRSLVLVAASLVLYIFWLNGKAYYLAGFAMIGLIAGLVWIVLGWKTLTKLLFPIAYLVLMIPIPIIERITYPLALFTGICSGALVRFLGVPINIVGNAVQMPGTDLLIGAQCSGINSMITLIALTSLCAYLFGGPMWGKIGLVLISIPLAMLGNILRVGNLLYVAYYWGVDAAFTFYHDYSGFVFFAVVLALLLPVMRLLRLKSLRMDVI